MPEQSPLQQFEAALVSHQQLLDADKIPRTDFLHSLDKLVRVGSGVVDQAQTDPADCKRFTVAMHTIFEAAGSGEVTTAPPLSLAQKEGFQTQARIYGALGALITPAETGPATEPTATTNLDLDSKKSSKSK
ncbi:MAG TPA: hypothetical protein VLE73_07030 [Candidatus Saccharimonadales bacterium]|nr:hypothetical protein [Candidatus Saccharimonadales bacterium]